VSFKCRNCPVDGRCDRCKGRNAKQRADERAPDYVPRGLARIIATELLRLADEAAGGLDDPMLLPDDGIHDGHAIDIAVHGRRPERLTYAERIEAATEMVRRGATAKEVCTNLSLPAVLTEMEWQTSPIASVRKYLSSTGLWIFRAP
jgi:hypothetical protein